MRRAVFLIVAFLAMPLFGEAAARIEGKVANEDMGLPGCTARIQSATLSRETTTDIEGRYVLSDVPPGSYDLSIELSGVRSIHRRIVVSPGVNTLPAEQMAFEVTEPIVIACGSPCANEPDSEYDRPSCDEYDLNTSLIEALERGDRSALTLLQQRYLRTSTFDERHRLAGALLRRVPDDSAYWNALAEHAANFVRFARAEGEYTPEFKQWCAERQLEPDKYWYMALRALSIARADRRSRPLLHRALESADPDVVMLAIQGLGEQHVDDALPAIERALQRLGEGAGWLAMYLSSFATEEADRLAMKYLSEDEPAMYEESRQPR